MSSENSVPVVDLVQWAYLDRKANLVSKVPVVDLVHWAYLDRKVNSVSTGNSVPVVDLVQQACLDSKVSLNLEADLVLKDPDLAAQAGLIQEASLANLYRMDCQYRALVEKEGPVTIQQISGRGTVQAILPDHSRYSPRSVQGRGPAVPVLGAMYQGVYPLQRRSSSRAT